MNAAAFGTGNSNYGKEGRESFDQSLFLGVGTLLNCSDCQRERSVCCYEWRRFA